MNNYPVKMPNIVGDVWFNSDPLTQQDYQDKVVLADFWTYSCVNCLRTIPYLQKWWEKYKDKNFLMIGIHAPEFEFEKDPGNVEKALKELKVTWPVVLDNNQTNWNNFSNHYWPAKYLADKKGYIVYEHFGEGSYKETEIAIRKLLVPEDNDLSAYKVEEEIMFGNVCFIPTPELYLGYKRGRIQNIEGYQFEKESFYDQSIYLKEDSITLHGDFLAKPEYVESIRKDATIFLNFFATEVNLVMSPVEKSATVSVSYNNQPLESLMSGKDVNSSGEVVVKEAKMYNLLKSREVKRGILSISVVKGNFRAYAFTFSGCVD